MPFLNKWNTNVFSSNGPVYESVAVGASAPVPPVNPLFVNPMAPLSKIVSSEPSICTLGNEPSEPFSVDESRPIWNILLSLSVTAVNVIG